MEKCFEQANGPYDCKVLVEYHYIWNAFNLWIIYKWMKLAPSLNPPCLRVTWAKATEQSESAEEPTPSLMST